MNRLWKAAFLVALFVGGSLGIAFPLRLSHALSSFSVQVYPGGNGYLTCGWHQTCLYPYQSGSALDFGDPTWVYFRSYGSTAAGSTVGQGRIVYLNPDQCHHLTYVDIYDAIGNYRTEVLYEHVQSGYGGYNFNIAGGIPYVSTEYYIGQTAAEPVTPTCPFTAKHVHEQGTGGGLTRNTTNYPDVSTCNATCNENLGNWAYWAFSASWQY